MSANACEQCDDYKAIVKSAVLDEKTFLRLTLSKKRRGILPHGRRSVCARS